jgi:hypothetical protein
MHGKACWKTHVKSKILWILSGLFCTMLVLTLCYINYFYNGDRFIPCSDVTIEEVWSKGFSKMLSEGAIRPLHVNQDNILDVVFPFTTGK